MKKTYLSYDKLKEYDQLIKAEIANGDTSSISSAKSYTDQQIQSVIDGEFIVSDAEHAESADEATHAVSADNATSATKATQDGNGKVISSTYETKTDATAKLTEAKAYTDTIASGKADAEHNHDAKYDKKGASDTAEANAKSYADSAIAKVKDDLLNGAGTAYDTLKELGDLIDTNVDAIDALETVASGKADVEHVHEIADVTGLQAELDEISAKADESDVFYINVTGDENQALTADKTYAEIENAYKDGKLPCVIYDSYAFQLADTYTNDFAFAALINNIYKLIRFKGQSGILMTKTEITLENGHTDFTTTSKTITGAIKELSSAKADIAHNHDDRYYTEAEVDEMIASKADASHNHAIADVTNLQSTLDGKANQSALDGVSAVANEAKVAAAANTQSITAHTSSINIHTNQISALQGLVGDGFEEITTAEIQALFSA